MPNTIKDDQKDPKDSKELKEYKINKKIIEEEVSREILNYYNNFENYSLGDIAKACAKILISNKYHYICFDNFQMPQYEEIRNLVFDEIRKNFDERIILAIDKMHPNLTDNELNNYISKSEKLYEKEHKEQIESVVLAVEREIKTRVKGLQRELKLLKRKYTI